MASTWGLNFGLPAWLLVQPALQDEPRRSKQVLGPSLDIAEMWSMKTDALENNT
jgi:hypothetical protein